MQNYPGPEWAKSLFLVLMHKACYAKNLSVFLSISLNMCFGFSKEPSHQDCSIEYLQHMFRLRNKKTNFQFHTLFWGPAYVFVFSRLQSTNDASTDGP